MLSRPFSIKECDSGTGFILDWDGSTRPDSRVMHFWDSDFRIGQWFAKNADGYDGVAWDIYYLFGPEATWETIPSPFAGSGITIYSECEQLQMQISPLLK